MAEDSWLDRRAVAMMRRPMAGVEAAFYEGVGARAVASVLGPVFSSLTGRVLDVGCGGDSLRLGTVGIDPSVGQLRRAVRRGTPMALAAASADGLPFATGSFDGVLSSCSLKHWPVLAAGLAECARVLRPGGRLVLAEIDGGAPGSGSGDLQRFARLTRLPPVVRSFYGILARRTFVPATPAPEVVAAALASVAVDVSWRRVDGLPFYVVEGHR